MAGSITETAAREGIHSTTFTHNNTETAAQEGIHGTAFTQ